MENQASTTRLSKILSIVLGLIIVGAVAALIYVITVPTHGDKFTEFYILGPDGKATDYPTQLWVGEEAPLILGIINREQNAVSYRVEIEIDGATVGRLEPIELKHGEKYEQLVTFTLNEPGDDQKVEFLLYKQGQTDVYDSLHLWINVKESPG